MPLVAQKPLMQTLVASQQSAAVTHFSCGAEHMPESGMFEHTSAPFGPLGSQ